MPRISRYYKAKEASLLTCVKAIEAWLITFTQRLTQLCWNREIGNYLCRPQTSWSIKVFCNLQLQQSWNIYGNMPSISFPSCRFFPIGYWFWIPFHWLLREKGNSWSIIFLLFFPSHVNYFVLCELVGKLEKTFWALSRGRINSWLTRKPELDLSTFSCWSKSPWIQWDIFEYTLLGSHCTAC